MKLIYKSAIILAFSLLNPPAHSDEKGINMVDSNNYALKLVELDGDWTFEGAPVGPSQGLDGDGVLASLTTGGTLHARFDDRDILIVRDGVIEVSYGSAAIVSGIGPIAAQRASNDQTNRKLTVRQGLLGISVQLGEQPTKRTYTVGNEDLSVMVPEGSAVILMAPPSEISVYVVRGHVSAALVSNQVDDVQIFDVMSGEALSVSDGRLNHAPIDADVLQTLHPVISKLS